MSGFEPGSESSRASDGERAFPRGESGFSPPAKHISDYWQIVRDRWIVAVAAFLAGFGSLGWSTLRATPVYESIGTIQIEDQPKSDSLLTELGASDLGTNVDADSARSKP